MVRAMVQVAQGLGMKTIAEFVETAETVEPDEPKPEPALTPVRASRP
jgi:hypothetical protein